MSQERCPTCNRKINIEFKRINGLTPRQWEYVDWFKTGLSNKRLAEKIFVTKKTVLWAINAINKRWGTKNKKEIIAKARELEKHG